jgi:hypothetical protein
MRGRSDAFVRLGRLIIQDREKSVKPVVFGPIVTVLLLAASIAPGADKEQPLQTPPLSADYAKQRDQILPNPREQSYRKIEWRNSVLRGLVDAQKKDKPVMIVLMNGHPLGCT